MIFHSLRENFSLVNLVVLLVIIVFFSAAPNALSEKIVRNDNDTRAAEKNSAEYWFNLGLSYSDERNYEESAKAFREAIGIKPNYAEAHNGIGIVYGRLGRHTAAREAFRQAIRMKANYVEAHYNLGVTYIKLKDRSSALLEEYMILKDLDRESADKLFNQIYPPRKK